MSILLIAFVAFAFLFILNKGALANVANFVRSQFGKLGRFLKEADPMSAYQQRIDDSVEQLKTAKANLAKAQGDLNKVERKRAGFANEVSLLTERIKTALASNNEKSAERWAGELVTAESNLASTATQLENNQATFERFVDLVKAHQDNILEAKREAQQLGIQLNLSEVNKEFAKLEDKFNFNNPLSDLSESREAVLSRIDENNAHSTVNELLDDGRSDEVALDKQGKVNNVLARFKASPTK
jgi:phage shock protein A